MDSSGNCPEHGVFPLEILILIAKELVDTQSLARLCMVNTRVNDALRPILYKDIYAFGIPEIQHICESVRTSAYHSGHLIHQLNLWLPWANDQDDPETDLPPCILTSNPELIPSIRAALSEMPDLIDLSVDVWPDDFDSIFEGLNPPFRLDKFLSQVVSSSVLVNFLRSQPSLTSIEFTGDQAAENLELWDQFYDHTILPSLRHITVPMNLLERFVPGRPVTRIGILGGSWAQNMSSIFNQSSLGVVWLEDTMREGLWDRCVSAFAMTALAATLKRLTFNLRVSIGRQFRVHDQPLRNLEVLYNSFPVLERLDFVSFTPGNPSEQNISDWLGGMNTIQKWRDLVPSLKVVVAFGRVID